jgi:hypothetical protein
VAAGRQTGGHPVLAGLQLDCVPGPGCCERNAKRQADLEGEPGRGSIGVDQRTHQPERSHARRGEADHAREHKRDAAADRGTPVPGAAQDQQRTQHQPGQSADRPGDEDREIAGGALE